MPTYMPTRLGATTDSHSAHVAPCFESAPHNLDACRSLAMHTAGAPLNNPAQVTAIPFRAQSAASAHREQLSIPILLPR